MTPPRRTDLMIIDVGNLPPPDSALTLALAPVDGTDLVDLLANAQPPRWARVVPPPHLSRRARARAGEIWSPEVQRRAEARPWLPIRARRALSADLAGSKEFNALNRAATRQTPRPDRRERRAIGAGPWPKLRRRAEAARRRARA